MNVYSSKQIFFTAVIFLGIGLFIGSVVSSTVTMNWVSGKLDVVAESVLSTSSSVDLLEQKMVKEYYISSLKEVIIYDLLNNNYDSSYANQFKFWFDADKLKESNGVNPVYRNNLKSILDSVTMKHTQSIYLMCAKTADDSLYTMTSDNYINIKSQY